MDDAIAREKQIKNGSRAKKIALIQAINPRIGATCTKSSTTERLDFAIAHPVIASDSDAIHAGAERCGEMDCFADARNDGGPRFRENLSRPPPLRREDAIHAAA